MAKKTPTSEITKNTKVVAKKGAKKGGRRHKRHETFAIYIYKVLK